MFQDILSSLTHEAPGSIACLLPRTSSGLQMPTVRVATQLWHYGSADISGQESSWLDPAFLDRWLDARLSIFSDI